MFAKIPYRGSVVKNVMHEMDSQEKQSEVKGKENRILFPVSFDKEFCRKITNSFF